MTVNDNQKCWLKISFHYFHLDSVSKNTVQCYITLCHSCIKIMYNNNKIMENVTNNDTGRIQRPYFCRSLPHLGTWIRLTLRELKEYFYACPCLNGADINVTTWNLRSSGVLETLKTIVTVILPLSINQSINQSIDRSID